MNLTFLETVILYCLSKINGERTIYSIYHLLVGKKSSQTIQDGHIFEIGIFFRTYTKLTREQLEHIVKRFQESSLILKVSEQHYQLTADGQALLQTQLSTTPIPVGLNGWKYHKVTEVFWGRLSLITQVASNLSHNETKYIPIQKSKEVLIWLKRFLVQSKLNRKELAEELYHEFIKCLSTTTSINPAIAVIRLTGHNKIGLTAIQSAEVLKLELTDYHYRFLGILHSMLDTIERSPDSFPLFNSIISDLNETVPITISTKTTFDLLNKGYSIPQIAQFRRLKESTIEDHIVELAINLSSFEITPYVDEKKKESILTAIKQADSKQLKHIRQLVPDASYFEIRLVIAKYGEEKWQ